MRKLSFRTQYDSDPIHKQLQNKTALKEFEPTHTIQDAPEADINKLMQRMGVKDGSILPTELGDIDPTFYGDFTERTDLRTTLDRARAAESIFKDLPAKIRNRFNNDPYELYHWVSNEQNKDEAVELGLLTKRPEKQKAEPMDVRIIPDKKEEVAPPPENK